MCQGTKLEPARDDFPERFFDTGICESHAVAFAAGQCKAGLRPVVVHGGGPQITTMLQRLDVYHEWRSGYRVTTPEAMDVVRMVLTGQVQREIVGLINEHGPYAVGISGEDGHLFMARKYLQDLLAELQSIPGAR